MAIRIERDRIANLVKFHGSTVPQFANKVLTAEVNSQDSTKVDVYNQVGTDGADKHYEFFAIPYTSFVDADNNPFADAAAAVGYINTASNASARYSGYHFQNSEFYLAGHEGSADVITDVQPDLLTAIKCSSVTASESGDELPEGLSNPYDPVTGLYTLTNFISTDIIQLRFAIDVEAFSDESSIDIVLTCTSPLGFSFTIEDQMISMDAGAGNYVGLVTIPIFIGDSLADNGTPATILPQIRLTGTTADIKPRGFNLYVWR